MKKKTRSFKIKYREPVAAAAVGTTTTAEAASARQLIVRAASRQRASARRTPFHSDIRPAERRDDLDSLRDHRQRDLALMFLFIIKKFFF